MGERTREAHRIRWLDALKGLAILSVILGHVLLGFTENHAFPADDPWMLKLMDWIYAWHMPLFFMISGFAFSISILKNGNADRSRLRDRILNLVLLYLFFSLLLGIFKIIFSQFVDHPMDWKSLITGLLLPDTLMWYLWVLTAYYLLMDLAAGRGFLNRKALFAAAVLLFAAGKVLEYTVGLRFCIRNLMGCLIFFVIGMTLKDSGLLSNKGMGRISAALSLGLSILFFAMEPGSTILGAAGILLSFSIPWTLFYFFHAKEISFSVLRKLGTASLVIYLLHTYIVTALKVLIIRTGILNGISAVLLTWAIAAIISWTAYAVSCRVRFLGYCFKPILLLKRNPRQKEEHA